ncbi:lipopolysaccharide assembly protein LapB [Pedobacter sp. SYSU D00535]|uniref:tetratricopeptide repeat protein n=1 Tax=Pedobacter sp. SYSU D00535 TaxID=2810308 RepID=UPI001A961E6C|nr:tetratricopeptide repeat protein [Pedobacter sp. SYSU D00535]
MRVNLPLFVGALLFLTNFSQAQAIDSLGTNTISKEVRIGPRNLVPEDLMDSTTLRKLKVDQYFRLKIAEAGKLRDLQDKQYLRLALADPAGTAATATTLHVLDDLNRIYAEADDTRGQADILISYGLYYGKSGDLNKAVGYFSQALRLKESLQDKQGIARTAENLALLYKALGKFDASILQARTNIKVNSSLKRSAETAGGYLLVAQNKILQGHYREAESIILQKSLPLFRRVGNKVGRMRSFETLGHLYYLDGKFSEAKWFYIQANMMADKIGDTESKISNLIGLAEVKYALGENELALGDYRKAEILAINKKSLVKLVQIKGSLGEVYREMGNYLAAGLAFEEYSNLRKNIPEMANL